MASRTSVTSKSVDQAQDLPRDRGSSAPCRRRPAATVVIEEADDRHLAALRNGGRELPPGRACAVDQHVGAPSSAGLRPIIAAEQIMGEAREAAIVRNSRTGWISPTVRGHARDADEGEDEGVERAIDEAGADDRDHRGPAGMAEDRAVEAAVDEDRDGDRPAPRPLRAMVAGERDPFLQPQVESRPDGPDADQSIGVSAKRRFSHRDRLSSRSEKERFHPVKLSLRLNIRKKPDMDGAL